MHADTYLSHNRKQGDKCKMYNKITCFAIHCVPIDFPSNTMHRVPMHPGKSWVFPGFSRPWKVLKNQFGPGKAWKLKLKVLNSCSNSTALTYIKYNTINFKTFVNWITLCMYSKSLLFVFIFKCWWTPRRSWKNVSTVLESPGIFSE